MLFSHLIHCYFSGNTHPVSGGKKGVHSFIPSTLHSTFMFSDQKDKNREKEVGMWYKTLLQSQIKTDILCHINEGSVVLYGISHGQDGKSQRRGRVRQWCAPLFSMTRRAIKNAWACVTWSFHSKGTHILINTLTESMHSLEKAQNYKD